MQIKGPQERLNLLSYYFLIVPNTKMCGEIFGAGLFFCSYFILYYHLNYLFYMITNHLQAGPQDKMLTTFLIVPTQKNVAVKFSAQLSSFAPYYFYLIHIPTYHSASKRICHYNAFLCSTHNVAVNLAYLTRGCQIINGDNKVSKEFF